MSRILTWEEVADICDYYEESGDSNTRRKFRKLALVKPFFKLMHFLEFDNSQDGHEFSDCEMESFYQNYNSFKIVHALIEGYIHLIINKEILNSPIRPDHLEAYRSKLENKVLLVELMSHPAVGIGNGELCYKNESGGISFVRPSAAKIFVSLDLSRFLNPISPHIKRAKGNIDLVMQVDSSRGGLTIHSYSRRSNGDEIGIPSELFEVSPTAILKEMSLKTAEGATVVTSITSAVRKFIRGYKGKEKTIDELAEAIAGKGDVRKAISKIIFEDDMAIESLGEAGLLSVSSNAAERIAAIYKKEAVKKGVEFESKVQSKFIMIMSDYLDDGMMDISYIQAYLSVSKKR